MATKTEIIDRVAERAGTTRADAQRTVEALLDTITDELKAGGDVTITGFGKFSVSNRAAREGVNPRDPSQKVKIAASRVPKFSAGSHLKQAVKG